ncbi:hypothetical protein GGS21DRAFT_531833 [Xylaria nigripes]|nr:hypothetical protein GGS21DRAFT_531833 [Xylaria nigripes]
MQQHTANSSQQIAPRPSGSLHTPTQSFCETQQSLDSQVPDWDDKQVTEYENIKNRLFHSRFNIREYPDPLLPRETFRSRYYPHGVTAEMEKHLLDVIAKIKGRAA